jgi:uncharacterized surface protein with fasciclin (FAS1) repeats
MKRMGVASLLLPLATTFVACSDTWDDHYDARSAAVREGSLWQAIEQNKQLSNFASVLKAAGYDKALASSQVFTVFAPTNDYLSSEQAAELIAAYNAEKDEVNDEDNTVVKEFIRNHVAMYNYSVAPSTQDTIVMMNGKYIALADGKVGNATFTAENSNNLYENGLLFVVDGQVTYEPNVFEYVRKDAELDSLASFLYSSRFYRKEFEPRLSVPGGIVDGRTVYLDSVFSQVNELFGYNFLSARLATEDSTYWMVAPTNSVWSRLVEEYNPYFQYDDKVNKRDSLNYTHTRLAIMQGAIFSRTLNSDAALADSAYSTLAEPGTYRQAYWGADFMHYYQYGDGTGYSTQKPLAAGGVLNGTRDVVCSNGVVKKADQWNFNPLNTFNKIIMVPASGRGAIQELSKNYNSQKKEWEDACEPVTRRTLTGTPYYGQLLTNNSFTEFRPGRDVYSVTFNLPNVLSNMGYDIYLVMPPALAVDTNATVIERLPTRLTSTIYYHNKAGEKDSTAIEEVKVTTPDIINYVLLAEDFKFPYASYGVSEDVPQTQLKISNVVTERQLLRETYTRTMYIAYILLVPHGISAVDDEYFYLSPHGDGVGYRMSKCNSITNPEEEQ